MSLAGCLLDSFAWSTVDRGPTLLEHRQLDTAFTSVVTVSYGHRKRIAYRMRPYSTSSVPLSERNQ